MMTKKDSNLLKKVDHVFYPLKCTDSAKAKGKFRQITVYDVRYDTSFIGLYWETELSKSMSDIRTQKLNVQSVHEVIKIGDTPADLLEGRNAGCRGVVGVLSGPRPIGQWCKYWHTHLIASVKELPELIESEFE